MNGNDHDHDHDHDHDVADGPRPPARVALPAAAVPLEARIESRAGFQAWVRDLLAEAAAVGCRELWLADADFATWPLGDRAVVESLAVWARVPGRQLHLVAGDFEVLQRLHPRWVGWRRQWAHQVECRANTEIERSRMPTILTAPGLFSLRLFDSVRCRGRLSRQAGDLQRDREALDAVLQQSHPALPATVAGL